LYNVRYEKKAGSFTIGEKGRKRHKRNVLGDSENDNPAFRKSDISIGIRSDPRLNPMLNCKYMLDFNQLPHFLGVLMDNDFIFSEGSIYLLMIQDLLAMN
jgi:hypothetical protein